MKRKLTSILLVMALCLPLAASTLASGAVEPPAPEETAALVPEETPTDPAEGEETIIKSEGVVWEWSGPKYYGQLPPMTDEEAEEPPADPAEGEETIIKSEGVVWKYGHVCWDDPPMTEDEFKEAVADLIEREGELEPGKTYALRTQYGHLCFDDPCQCSAAADTKLDGIASAGSSEAGICPACGKDNWGPATDTDSALVRIGDDYHGELYNTAYVCKTAHCDYSCRIHKIKQAAPHSWNLTATAGNSGSEGSAHRFNLYECECGAGKAETTAP